MKRVGLPWWNAISGSHTGQVFNEILTTKEIILLQDNFKNSLMHELVKYNFTVKPKIKKFFVLATCS